VSLLRLGASHHRIHCIVPGRALIGSPGVQYRDQAAPAGQVTSQVSDHVEGVCTMREKVAAHPEISKKQRQGLC
jgi:hypothetical protein